MELTLILVIVLSEIKLLLFDIVVLLSAPLGEVALLLLLVCRGTEKLKTRPIIARKTKAYWREPTAVP